MIASRHYAQHNERLKFLRSVVDTCAKRVCMKFDTITLPYLDRQCFRRPLPVSTPAICSTNQTMNDGNQITVRFKFQTSSASRCVEGLSWIGAQTDIFIGEDVTFWRTWTCADLFPRSFFLTLVRDTGVKHLLLSLLRIIFFRLPIGTLHFNLRDGAVHWYFAEIYLQIRATRA